MNFLTFHRRRHLVRMLLLVLAMVGWTTLHSQEKITVQVKTLDTQLRPYRNLSISINDHEFVSLGAKAVAFTDLEERDFPIRTVRIKDDQLEAASWNYSKGTLDVIVRTKSYKITEIEIRDAKNKILPNLKLIHKGRRTLTLTTDSKGRTDLPLGLEDKLLAEQFSATGFTVTGLTQSGTIHILTLDPIVAKDLQTEQTKTSAPIQQPKASSSKEYFRDFDLSKLDSIQSLTVFYAIFKNYQFRELSPEVRKRIDDKFNALVAELQDTTRRAEIPKFIARISDTSHVKEDVKYLLEQAIEEKRTLAVQREEFNEKIRIINQKLAAGVENLDAATRAQLMNDISLLEKLLMENESQFYKNQNDYRQLISALKEKFFDLENLENRLSESEAQRLEEQRVFRQKLFVISGLVILFGVLIVMLITFAARLRRQKKELVLANAEVKRINENLESIVSERTKLLEEANRELDTFLYRASHDMRSPVCSIIGLCNIASLLSQGEPKELIQRVVNTTEGMDKLLKKLSIISEINQPTNLSSITLLDLVDDVSMGFGKMLQEQKISYRVDCPADLVIFSYPGLVETILYNLIENAIFFSSLQDVRQPKVEVRAWVADNSVVITVQDNGIGIEKTIKHRLFDMFFKGTERSKGHGLGLYIVQKAVATLEGEVTMESIHGESSVFTVRLPLQLSESLITQGHVELAGAAAQ